MNDKQELIEALQAIPWFQVMPEEHFNKMANIARIFTFEPGQVIFREGDKEDFMYVVVEGRVAIEISVPGRGRTRILTADAGEGKESFRVEVDSWSIQTNFYDLD